MWQDKEVKADVYKVVTFKVYHLMSQYKLHTPPHMTVDWSEEAIASFTLSSHCSISEVMWILHVLRQAGSLYWCVYNIELR